MNEVLVVIESISFSDTSELDKAELSESYCSSTRDSAKFLLYNVLLIKFIFKFFLFIESWGLGIGDWLFWIGYWGLCLIFNF